jgi:5-formyltetrahydrofolate cyclo-ligase
VNLSSQLKEIRDDLRREFQLKRKAISAETVLVDSQRCLNQIENLFNFLRIESPVVIGSYRSRLGSGEINLDQLPKQHQFSGHSFAFPRILSAADSEMGFSLCSHESDFVLSAFRIFEPLPTLPLLQREAVDLFLIPGVAFNLRGERLGQGMGFYDRHLAQCPKAVRIGVAHELQLSELSLHSQPWDQAMDYLVTPERYIDCRSFVDVGEKTK